MYFKIIFSKLLTFNHGIIVFIHPFISSKNGDTIKIVSWNVQMLPKVFQPFTKLTRKKQKIRAPKIIQYLNASDFDLIVLQEVFDKPIQKK